MKPLSLSKIRSGRIPEHPSEYLAIGTIPVVNEVLWSHLPAACLSELTRDPLGGRVRGGPQS